MTKCVIATRDPQDWEIGLQRPEFTSLDAFISDDIDEVTKHLVEAEIAFGIPAFLAPGINAATNLKWIQSSFAGIDALCADGLRRDYLLTNVKDVYGKPIAEYVFAYVLAQKRRLTQHRQWQDASEWRQSESDVIEGETMAIFGTGSIGAEIARIAKAFGLSTIGVSRSGSSAEHFDSVHAVSDLTALAAEPLDYVVGVLPGTASTNNYFDTSIFEQLSGSPTFINVGRGSSVVEEDVLSALDNGHLSHAVLDVFQNEPLVAESPLWAHPKVTVTPHNSGYVSLAPVIDIVAKNYVRYTNSEELLHRVDFELGY